MFMKAPSRVRLVEAASAPLSRSRWRQPGRAWRDGATFTVSVAGVYRGNRDAMIGAGLL